MDNSLRDRNVDDLPNGGKVVIVDDRFQEVLPLINILNKNAIPVIYYTGKVNELPKMPLQGIRIFFLDLRFSTNIDSKTIASNACGILKTILGENNGPYLLIIWSSTGNQYKDDIERILEGKGYQPEFILCLSKADYFQTKDSDAYTLIDDIKEILLEEQVENVDSIIDKITDKVICEEDESEKVFISESIDKLQKELYNGLKKAGLLSLFILWENTIRNSAHKVVNEIFSQIPKSIPEDKKLPAMTYYLAKNRLEKQFELVEEKDKLRAVLLELNELYEYFYSEDVIKISVDDFLPLNIQKNVDLVPSQAKFNSWKLIRKVDTELCSTPAYKIDTPGSIYKDEKKIFEFFGLVRDYSNREKYYETIRKLRDNEQILYIFANINGECETAQNKYPVIRVMPGILIPCNIYKEYEKNKLLNPINRAKSYIFNEFEPIEYNEIEYYLLFNINQSMFLDKKEMENLETYFILHRKYYLKLRQSLVEDFSKQGLDLYGAK